MAYRDDIDGLNPDHHWVLESNSNDSVGTANGTDTSMQYVGSAITEDASNAAGMNSRGDRVSLPTTTSINNSAQERKAVCGWFAVSGVELPSCRIYGEGDQTTNFQFLILPGNSVLLEVRDAGFQVQVYSDVALAVDRAYHLCGVFEGSTYGDEVRFWIDGVEQTAAIPTDRAPGSANLDTRGVGEFGDPAGTVGMDGVALLMQSPGDTIDQTVIATYNHWAVWDDVADAVLSDTDVRETLFERGALADVTIATGTEAAMQTALDVFSATTRGDAPLCIEINPVTGGGDFTLDVDDITFNERASLHIRYNGTSGTLTLRNTNGSNASIVAAPFGGTVELRAEVTVTVTALDATTLSPIQGAIVFLETTTGGPAASGVDILDGTLRTDAQGQVTTTYDYESDQPVVGTARKGTSLPVYEPGSIAESVTINGLDTTVLLVPDSESQ